MTPKVSVIIPAYNEEDVIEDCLRSLENQSFKDYQVILIDDASTDSTKSIIQRYCQKHPKSFFLHEYGKVGPGKARNLSAYQCGSEFLVFMDADCIATPNWIEELLKAFSNDEVGSVGGPHFAPKDSNPFQRQVEKCLTLLTGFIDFYKTNSGDIREVAHNPLCNVAYRRDVFMRLRGFREDLFPGEDVELDLRVIREGFKIMFNPNAIVYHHRPEDIQAWKKVLRAYGRAQGKLVRENGIQRPIQWLGFFWIAFWGSLFWGFFKSFGALGVILSLSFLLVHLFFRPKWNNFIGALLCLGEWPLGFFYGFFTKRSPPPGQ